MTASMISILVFMTIVLLGLLLFKPMFSQYVHCYQVRIRPRKDEVMCAAAKPKDSLILKTMMTLGQLALGAFPALADRRAITLLTIANYRTPDHLAIFTGIRATGATCVLGMGVIAAANNPINLILAVPAAVLAWLTPNFFLSKRASDRKDQVLRELPVVIDLMIVCAQAGLGLMSGLEKISNEVTDSCPTLSQELKQMINDIKLFAKSAPYALREMGERCGVDELINMASALIAAEAKGADISYPLKQQSEALRDRLKRKKEELAGKVPVKMVPVIMVFIMPLILAPMLGPAVVTIVAAVEPVLKGMH